MLHFVVVVTSVNGAVTNASLNTYSTNPIDSFDLTESLDSDNCSKMKSNDDANSNDSEGGTYTLDKNNHQVLLARKSIDQVFGIVSNSEISSDTSVSNYLFNFLL